MISFLDRANLITYVGVFSSIVGVYAALQNNFTASMICLMIAGNADLLDGWFARKFKRTDAEKSFGGHLDSLADTINFAALPVVIYFSFGSKSIFTFAIGFFFCFCGISRLAYFNTTNVMLDNQEARKYFRGVPITYIATFFPIFGVSYYYVSPVVFTIIASALLVVMGVLYILDIPIKKPKPQSYPFFISLTVVFVVIYIGCGLRWNK